MIIRNLTYKCLASKIYIERNQLLRWDVLILETRYHHKVYPICHAHSLHAVCLVRFTLSCMVISYDIFTHIPRGDLTDTRPIV